MMNTSTPKSTKLDKTLSVLLIPLNLILYVVYLNHEASTLNGLALAWTVPALAAVMFFGITYTFENRGKALKILGALCLLIAVALVIFYVWLLALGEAFKHQTYSPYSNSPAITSSMPIHEHHH